MVTRREFLGWLVGIIGEWILGIRKWGRILRQAQDVNEDVMGSEGWCVPWGVMWVVGENEVEPEPQVWRVFMPMVEVSDGD